MSARLVEIDLDQLGRNGRIVIDGQDVSAMTRGIVFQGQVDEPIRIVLDLMPKALKAKLEAEVALDSDTHQILVDLGWTPPGGTS